MRHNRIQDLEADSMKEIVYDIKIEPELLPLETDNDRRGNNKDKHAWMCLVLVYGDLTKEHF